jgi:hypothetical protein
VSGQRHAAAALYPRERPGTHCTGGWVGLRAGLDRCGKSRPPNRIRSPDRPACSQSLYRLSYPAHKLPLNTAQYSGKAQFRPRVHCRWYACLLSQFSLGRVIECNISVIFVKVFLLVQTAECTLQIQNTVK